MKALKKNIFVQLQCYLWIALIAFSTIGCSAKKNFFQAFELSIETPISGSKALALSSYLSICDAEVLTRNSIHDKSSIAKKALFLDNDFKLERNLSFIPQLSVFLEDYFFELAGTSPPLYLIFKKIKVALV